MGKIKSIQNLFGETSRDTATWAGKYQNSSLRIAEV
jgi:hypothetical protein